MCKRFKKLAAKTMAAITTITLSITALLPSFASAAGDQFDTDGDFLTSGITISFDSPIGPGSTRVLVTRDGKGVWCLNPDKYGTSDLNPSDNETADQDWANMTDAQKESISKMMYAANLNLNESSFAAVQEYIWEIVNENRARNGGKVWHIDLHFPGKAETRAKLEQAIKELDDLPTVGSNALAPSAESAKAAPYTIGTDYSTTLQGTQFKYISINGGAAQRFESGDSVTAGNFKISAVPDSPGTFKIQTSLPEGEKGSYTVQFVRDPADVGKTSSNSECGVILATAANPRLQNRIYQGTLNMSTGWAIFSNERAADPEEPEKPERPPVPIPRFPSITIEGHKLDEEPGFDGDACTPRGDGTLGAVISYTWETDMGKSGSGRIQLDHWGHGSVLAKIWAEAADVLQTLDDDGVTYEGSAAVTMKETSVPEGYLPGDGGTVTDIVTFYAYAPWIEPEDEDGEGHWGPFQYKIGSAYGEFENLVEKGMFQLVKEKDDDLDPFTRPTGDKDYMKNAKWTLELVSGGSENQPFVRVVPIGQSDPKYNPLFNSYRAVIDGSGTPADKNNPLLTNEFGQLVIYDLPYGTYRLKEIEAEVEGYVLEDYTFTVDENGQILSQDIDDYVIRNEVVVEKVDSETGKVIPMAGTAFRIRYMGNPNTAAAGGDVTKDPHYGTYLPNGSSINDSYKWVFYTDFNGRIVLPYELEYGLYQLEEIVAPEGYYIGSYDQSGVGETVDGNRDFGETVAVCDAEGNKIEYLENEDIIYNYYSFSVLEQQKGEVKRITVKMADNAVKGKLEIYKTGERLVGFKAVSTPQGIAYEPVYEQQPLPGAAFEILSAEDITLYDAPDYPVPYTADGDKIELALNTHSHAWFPEAVRIESTELDDGTTLYAVQQAKQDAEGTDDSGNHSYAVLQTASQTGSTYSLSYTGTEPYAWGEQEYLLDVTWTFEFQLEYAAGGWNYTDFIIEKTIAAPDFIPAYEGQMPVIFNGSSKIGYETASHENRNQSELKELVNEPVTPDAEKMQYIRPSIQSYLVPRFDSTLIYTNLPEIPEELTNQGYRLRSSEGNRYLLSTGALDTEMAAVVDEDGNAQWMLVEEISDEELLKPLFASECVVNLPELPDGAKWLAIDSRQFLITLADGEIQTAVEAADENGESEIRWIPYEPDNEGLISNKPKAPEGWQDYYIDNHYMVRNIENPNLYMVYIYDAVRNQNRWVPADVDGTTFTEYTQKLSMRLTQHSSSADGWSLAIDGFEFINIADSASEEAAAVFVNPFDAEAEVIPAGGSEAETIDQTTTITVRLPEPSVWYKTSDGIQIGTVYQGGYTKTILKVPEEADLPEISYKNGAAIDYDGNLTPDHPSFEQIQDQYNYLWVKLQPATAGREEMRIIELVSDAETDGDSWQVRLPSGHLVTAIVIEEEDGLRRGQLTFDALAKTMRYPQGVVVETIRAGADGIATSSALPLGDYLVREAAAPNGYVASKDVYPISFVYEGQYIPLVWGSTSVSNDSFSVQLDLRKSFETAYGSGTFVPKAGAVFGVFAKEAISGGSPMGTDLAFDRQSIDAGTLLYLLTTDSDGKAIQTVKLPMGDYYVKELATLDGYILNDQEFPFRVDEETTSDELHFSYPTAGISGQVVHDGCQAAEIRIDTHFQFPAVVHKVNGMAFWSDEAAEGRITGGAYVDSIVQPDYSSLLVKMSIYEPVTEIELSNGSVLTVTLTDEGFAAVFIDPEEAVEIPAGQVGNLTVEADGQTTAAVYNPVVAYTGYQLSVSAPYIPPETLLTLNGITAGFDFDLASGRKNIVIDYSLAPDTEVTFEPPAADGITWDKQGRKIVVDTSVSAVQQIAVGDSVFNLTADSIQADGASVPQGYRREGLTGAGDSLIWQNKKISLSSASGLTIAEAVLAHDQRMAIVSVTAGTANNVLLDGVHLNVPAEAVALNPGQQLLILASDGAVFTFELSNTGTLTAKVDGIVSGELNIPPEAALNGSPENLLKADGEVLLQTVPMNGKTVDEIRLQANRNLTFARSSSYVAALEVKINAGSGNASAPIVNKPEKPEEPEKPKEPDKPRPKPKEMTISKKDTTTAEGVPSAEIEVLDEDGNLIASGKSDQNGEFKFKMPKPGAYYFHEITAPDGYILNEEFYSFTVHENGSITGDNTIENQREMTISKKDTTTAEGVPGAEIEVLDEDGNIIASGKSDQNGEFKFGMPRPGTYYFHEVAAPDGYILNEEFYSFTVHENGSITGDRTILNRRKIGRIDLSTDEWFEVGEDDTPTTGLDIPSPPKTGESFLETNFQAEDVLQVTFIQDIDDRTAPPETLERDGKSYRLLEYSSEAVNPGEAPEPITESYTDLENQDENELPQTIVKNGITYTLESAVFEEIPGEERSVWLTKRIEAENGNVPQEYRTAYYDGLFGETVQGVLPLQRVEQAEPVWAEDKIDSRYYDYDTELFQLGNALVPKNETAPEWQGYEADILAYLGQSAESCRLTGSDWVGDAYMLDGVLVRDAVYYCERLVPGSVTAVYEGNVALRREAASYTAEAVYTAPAPEVTEQIITASYQLIPDEPASTGTLQEIPQPKKLPVLAKVLIFGGVLVILGLLTAAILFSLKKKRREKEEKTQRIEARPAKKSQAPK